MEGTIRSIHELQPKAEDFSSNSRFEIRKSVIVLSLIGSPIGMLIGRFFEKFRFLLKFILIRKIIESTVFKQFCGGTSLEDSKGTIKKLSDRGILTVLDYAGEGFETESDFDKSMGKIIESIYFAAQNPNASTISMKITSIGSSKVLEKYHEGSIQLDENTALDKILYRLQSICSEAHFKGVTVFIDAEESWLQHAIDDLTIQMMSLFNRKRPVIYNTYQMYLKDSFVKLQKHCESANSSRYILGVKLVRGAYMEKETEKAQKNHYENPVHNSKSEVDSDFDEAIFYCFKRFEDVATCIATHNKKSLALACDMLRTENIPLKHDHIQFCQLYGMSDWMTTQISQKGHKTSKYLPYGTPYELIPYLVRRSQENSAAQEGINSELAVLKNELKRRND